MSGTRLGALAEQPVETGSEPRYELRIRKDGASESTWEVWQLRSPATQHIKEPRRIGGLYGRNLALVEHRLLSQLRRIGHDLTGILPSGARRFELEETEALRLGLLFRVLAPMRSRSNMKACVAGVEGLSKEEASYWLGMAMHRKYPRRVLMALRFLLIDPKNP